MTREQLGALILDSERQLYSTAKTILYSDQDCADAIQDTIVKAFSKIQTLKNDKYARTWLIRILINECYTILRKSSKLTSLDMMDEQTDAETCVLNWDGTMDIYQPGQVELQQLIEKGAYQSWVFGPSLLDEKGKAKDKFLTWDYIRESHPRTAIGYYEPGHYCLLLVDGRQDSSRGMFPDEMAKVFEELGCKAAYNLDGGHCSFMTFLDKVANHPYKPEHEVADGIFITEGL